jgi:glutamate 5-kinase
VLTAGKSRLPVGVVGVEGEFQPGDMVSVVMDEDGTPREIARGLVNYAADDLRKIQQCKSKEIVKRLGHRDFDEAIHRDNLVVL